MTKTRTTSGRANTYNKFRAEHTCPSGPITGRCTYEQPDDRSSPDLDEVASTLTNLRPGWVAQGLTAGTLTWRDASASWPRPLLTNRSTVLEPESVGITLTAADGREGRLVIWRGGWADVDVLADGTVTSRNPAIHDVAECIDLASQPPGEPAHTRVNRKTQRPSESNP